ncbi:MAG: hypothetical protein FD138_768 [Planctomycetota bacterium]|nr:MAG: hypothetical protein FD138_768 [Planctomycetota bacterium]
MRIDGESFGSPLFGRRPVRPGAASGSRRTSSTKSSATAGSRETSEFMSKLQALPEVRPEVVEDVRQRLQRGELLTREAAEATANAILSDLQSFLSP